jgi:murein DD-endopeptidase MepM/ murein hydrolase activator NlpD
VVVAAVVGLSACSGPAGLRYQVKPGDNLYRIGKAYGVAVPELARENNIKDPSRIEVGTLLVVPHATRELPVQMITPERARADRPSDLPGGAPPFAWPVTTGVLSSRFGSRGEGHHDGVDISCAEGTPVRAARAGRVLYSDTLRGYGNLIILEHDGGWATVYAHNRENRARVGQAVRQGDVIAAVGESGKTSGPNLHFEVRKDNVACNPLFFLPPVQAAGAAEPTRNMVQGGA